MSVLMDLYAGDADGIGRAFTRNDFPALENPRMVLAHADLSLDLWFVDFDSLTQAVSRLAGGGPASFVESLGRSVGGTPDESDASVVDPHWVELMAGVPDASLPELARAWWTAVRAELASIPAYAEGGIPRDPDPTPPLGVEEALRAIVAVCRTARERGASVVFTWSL